MPTVPFNCQLDQWNWNFIGQGILPPPNSACPDCAEINGHSSS